MALLPVAQALSRLLDGAAPGPAEKVEIGEAAGRVLAWPLLALRTQPPFDSSAMDGYAVRSADVARVPASLEVIGSAPAGRPFDGRITQGKAVRIFTGAPIPDGADTIVIQENAVASGNDTIEVVETVAAGRHIRKRGLDFREGDVILEAGRLLDPAAVSLAASANHPTLEVVTRPLVALIATGDELLPPGSRPGPGQIIASNAYGVAAIAEAAGARVLDLGIVPDRRPAVAEAIGRASAARADVVVTLGGASVGDHDFIHDVLVAEGVSVGFWKIAMRPGKPLMFGRRGPTRFVGLPGNPVASIVCSLLFLQPLLARLGGREHRHDYRGATLGAPLPANDLREDYIRAAVTQTPAGLVATPYETQDSSMLRTLSDARCLIIRAPFASASPAGEACTVLMLR
jgi:molybdopterin molybdotransferase